MTIIRLFLALFRLGYLPKIGVRYMYSSCGPYGDTLIPLEKAQGYVKYAVHCVNGVVVENSATYSTWAVMCIERDLPMAMEKKV